MMPCITGLFGEAHQSGRKETSLVQFGMFRRWLKNIILSNVSQVIGKYYWNWNTIGKYYIQLLECPIPTTSTTTVTAPPMPKNFFPNNFQIKNKAWLMILMITGNIVSRCCRTHILIFTGGTLHIKISIELWNCELIVKFQSKCEML